MIFDITKNIYSYIKKKFFKEEELDISNKKFHLGKFLFILSFCVVVALDIWEGYLIQKIAFRYRELDIEHAKLLKDYNESKTMYEKQLDEYRYMLFYRAERYRLINKCLQDNGYKSPEFKDGGNKPPVLDE